MKKYERKNNNKETWKIVATKNCGKRHESKKMLSQDQYFIRSKDGKHIAVLADGIGKTNLNVVGVEMVTQITAKYIGEKFDWISTEKPEVIVEDLIVTIGENLCEMADEYHVPVKTFASTLMAFCVDETKDRYCLFHLGDGVILYRDPAGQMRVLSFPEIGFHSVMTTLTTSVDAFDRLKFMRGSAERISQLAMLTDGVYESNQSPEYFNDVMQKILQHETLNQEVDDKGAVMLYRTTENGTK